MLFLTILSIAIFIIAAANDSNIDSNGKVFGNLTTSSYDSSTSVKWANSYCAKDSEWLWCAEFVARALNAGGMFPGVTDYGNYNGYNPIWGMFLTSTKPHLVHYGWSQSSSGTWCGSAGQVLIYNGDEHAALAIGNCLLDQHNPSRCGTNSQWGTNIVLKPWYSIQLPVAQIVCRQLVIGWS